jgi:hypothetical protein
MRPMRQSQNLAQQNYYQRQARKAQQADYSRRLRSMKAPVRLVSAEEEIGDRPIADKNAPRHKNAPRKTNSKQETNELVSVMTQQKKDMEKPVYQTVYQTANQEGWTVPEKVEYAAPPKPAPDWDVPPIEQPKRVARNTLPKPKTNQQQAAVDEESSAALDESNLVPPVTNRTRVGMRQQDTSSVMIGEPVEDPFADRTPKFRPARQFRRIQDKDSTQDPLNQQDIPEDLDDVPGSAAEKSCDEFRNEIFSQSIKQIDLNISPYGPRVRGVPQAVIGSSRTWIDRHGEILTTGAMINLRHGYVHIDTGTEIVRIPVARLGEADLAQVAMLWKTPAPCTLGIHPFPERSWCPQTYTWKASALCHKPLYFEDVQLERYGHSAGPFRQPLRSTVHFFTRLVFWPYQTAIHPPNECQYALGYYRPGNCAPWLVDPIPLSIRGAARQAAVTVGSAYLFFP